MGGKTFPAVQFLDTFHDHIKPITKTKPRTPLAFLLPKAQGRTKQKLSWVGWAGIWSPGSPGVMLGLLDLQLYWQPLKCSFIQQILMVFTSQGTVLVLKTQEGHITKMDKVSGSEASFLLGIEVGDMQLTRKQAGSLQWQEPEGRWNWDGMGRLWRAESGRPPKGGGIWTETWMMKRSQVNSWWESLAGKGKREEQVQRP